jgi:toxin ParE1/3/4
LKIIWSPLSIDRAREIAEYIALDNKSAYKRWIENILNNVDILQSSPKAGRIIPEIEREEIRKLIYGNYHIIYRVEKDRVSILTIRHGKQILPIDEILL